MASDMKSCEDLVDPDFFNNIKSAIEKELDGIKKIVNNINQMRVEAAYLESDLMLTVDAEAWEQISQLIAPAPMKIDDEVTVKIEPK